MIEIIMLIFHSIFTKSFIVASFIIVGTIFIFYLLDKDSDRSILHKLEMNGMMLRNLDMEQTEDMCLTAVKQNGMALQFVKDKTLRVNLAAVEQNGLAIQFIPYKDRAKHVMFSAIRNNPKALLLMEYMSYDLCIDAIKMDYTMMQYIDNPSPKLIEEAIKIEPGVVNYIKNDNTFDISDDANKNVVDLEQLEQDGLLLKNVPKNKQTEEMCITAINQNPNAYYYVRIRTPTVLLTAVKKNPWLIEEMSRSEQTEEMCLEAVSRAGATLMHIYDSIKNDKICITAVKQLHFAMFYVPPRCIQAVRNSHKN